MSRNSPSKEELKSVPGRMDSMYNELDAERTWYLQGTAGSEWSSQWREEEAITGDKATEVSRGHIKNDSLSHMKAFGRYLIVQEGMGDGFQAGEWHH